MLIVDYILGYTRLLSEMNWIETTNTLDDEEILSPLCQHKLQAISFTELRAIHDFLGPRKMIIVVWIFRAENVNEG